MRPARARVRLFPDICDREVLLERSEGARMEPGCKRATLLAPPAPTRPSVIPVAQQPTRGAGEVWSVDAHWW